MSSRIFAVLVGYFILLTGGVMVPSLSLGDDGDRNARHERRMILDEDFSWLTAKDADRLIEDIVAAGFNAVVPAVWHGRGVSWISDMAPKEPRWSAKKDALQDPLRYLIERAHANGVEVHPWFTVSLRQREFLPRFYDTGTPPRAFNVHSKEFRAFIVDLILEVVSNYPVDGINLDYIRASGVCTSAACISDYQSRSGGNLLYDTKNMWRSTQAADRIARWLQEPVGDIVEQLATKAREIRPGLLISVDSHPEKKWVYVDGGDSVAWANKGWVDLVLDMQYEPRLDVQSFERTLARMKHPERLVLMPGNYEKSDFSASRVWPRNAVLVARLLEQARDLSARSGTVALYEYRFLTKEQIKRLRAGPFKDAAR